MSKSGLALIVDERNRQLNKGRSIEADKENNTDSQLVAAASALLHTNEDVDEINALVELYQPMLYNWDMIFFTDMMLRPYKERIIIAGALCAAELDRIQE